MLSTQNPGLLLKLSMLLILSACGGASRPTIQSQAPSAQRRPQTPKLQNHFKRDRIQGLNEAAMREILAAPVYLERGARIGVVPVVEGYELDHQLPLEEITGALSLKLSQSGYFKIASEVTTGWPGGRSVSGLREIAARYRAEYLLLYRQRFVDRSFLNAWGWTYPTILGWFFAPASTLESVGVLEATLFDVKTGTLLFTIFERTHGALDSNIWHQERKSRRLKEKLLVAASEKLIQKMSARLDELVAARPKLESESLAQR